MLNTICKITHKSHSGVQTDEFLVEEISHRGFVVRNNSDAKMTISHSKISDIKVISDPDNGLEEDDYHDFTMNMLHCRKETELLSLTDTIMGVFDKIMGYCPENYDTLQEELNINLKAFIHARLNPED